MLDNLKAINLRRFNLMQITLHFDTIAKHIINFKSRYQNADRLSGVPWPIIAAIHMRESSMNFNTQLAQGDPLGRVSTHVPKSQGPYFGTDAWDRAAGRALIETGGKTWGDWTPGGWTTYLEKYNGLGYANKNRPSPYVWAGTDQYKSGKYVADGVYSTTEVDIQPGCVSMISAIAKQDPTINLQNLNQPIKGKPTMNFLNAIWHNPFTSSMGAAAFVVGLLHLFNIPLPVDATFLAGIFTSLGLFAAHDGGPVVTPPALAPVVHVYTPEPTSVTP